MTISRPLLLTFAFLLGLAVTVSGQTPRSPFGNGPKAANGPAANADAQPLTLSGVITTGSGTLVCITTTGDRRSHWIKVGDKSDGIEVLRHDPATHAVVVAYDNREISLGLKQAPVIPVESRPIYTSTPALTGPAPVAGVATSVAVTNEEKEREARFLVSASPDN